VLEEFGLNLLHFLLKRGSLRADSAEHMARLDPLWPLVLDSLGSAHAPVITAGLKCLAWLLRLPLASLRDESSVAGLTRRVFALLRKFGGGATDNSKGEHYDLVATASKLLVVLIRDIQTSRLEEEQLQQVLDYVLLDVMDPLKQTTAFGLLSAIMGRRLASESLFQVVMKLAELSIQVG
jgi:U3 small nucleolar RNA-associated protein 20